MKLMNWFHVLALMFAVYNKEVQSQQYRGRDVALNQPTRQSSTYTAPGIAYGSDKAVDGNLSDPTSDLKYCTHTAVNDTNPWFEVRFPRSNIFTIVIHNRDNNLCKHRLSFFQLQIFDGDTSVNITRGPNMTDKMSLVINFVPSIVATRVNISTIYKANGDPNPILTICELQIYAVDNIALHRKTVQSTTYNTGLIYYGSEKAVDGNTNGTFTAGKSCSHTADGDSNPWFEVTFPDANIYAIKIYNRVDYSLPRLSKYKLEVFIDNIPTTRKDLTDSIVNAIDFPKKVNGNKARITLRTVSTEPLTICEINIFGDIIDCSQPGNRCFQECCSETCTTPPSQCTCQPGYMGKFCNQTCDQGKYGYKCQSNCGSNCFNNSCHIMTGVCDNICRNPPECTKPCDQGKFGRNCQSICSSNCFENTCNRITGLCDNGCFGFSDSPVCNSPCSPGKYGLNCQFSCSNCFKNTCDSKTGVCNDGCNGFSDPPTCNTTCVPGKFGRNCTSNCSSHCFNNTCDKITGLCDNGCNGYSDPQICYIHCTPGKFGRNCTSDCSNCFNTSCNATTGVCDIGCNGFSNPPTCNTTCVKGKHGQDCLRNCSSNCYNTSCNAISGECDKGCFGYSNPSLCTTKCDDTYYGPNCTLPCNSSCLNQSCHHITAKCSDCPNGTYGDSCQGCPQGMFGYHCSESCSSNCSSSNVCNATNGQCLNGCKDGFLGDMCDSECPNNTFGRDCANNCSTHCSSPSAINLRLCDHRDGMCFGVCLDGYTGPQCLQADKATQGPPVGVIVGVIIAAVVIVLVIVAGVIFWKRRHPQKQNDLNRETRTVVKELPERLSLQSKGTKETSVDDDEYKTETAYYNTSPELGVIMAIKVNELNTYMRTHDKQFFLEQFKKIPQALNVTTESALSDENKNKNRYKNICPYDHSRVNLLINKERKEGDYINASYIHDNNNKVKFIASQGPNKTMINDFIRMLWEQKTEVVVMLTNLIEEGKVKCERYWPDSGKTNFGEITVKLNKTQTFADYTIRRIELEKSDEEPRLFTHFHFTSWPDQSTPTAPWALVDFAQKVFAEATTSPIVVHCSAGVGRTGTFIALHNILQQAEATGQVDFYNTLVKLRKDRIFMIQTADQYAFLHRAAQVAILCNESFLDLKDISARLKHLKQTEISKLTIMEKEFQSMKAVSDDIRHSQDEAGHEHSAKEQVYQNSLQFKQDVKNRFPSIVPRNCDRPFLTCYGKDMSDYINSVFVQGFHKKDHHILTQLPMPTTVTDLWRLVTQYKISLMVAFETDTIPKDQTMAGYLPAVKGASMLIDYFEVKCMNVQQDELWEEQTLKVRSDKAKSDSQDVVHLKCKFTSLESKYLLRLVKKIKSYNLQADGKILYMCRDGATYSGLCCVLSNLLDILDSDSSLSVPLVVGAVKTIRPEVIPDMEQYRTVYEVLEKYSDISTPYSNIDENYFPRALKPVKNKPPSSETLTDDNINVYNNV